MLNNILYYLLCSQIKIKNNSVLREYIKKDLF